jgi:hypothetical protein
MKSLKQQDSPHEEQRLPVPRVLIERTVENLNEYEYVQGCTVE